MRRPLALAALLATATLLGFGAGCGENAAEDKPEAITGPARPVEPLADATPEPGAVSDPSASASETGTEPESIPAGAEALTFSDEDGSTIKFVGSKLVGGSHDGGFKDFEGTMYLDPEVGKVQRVETDIQMDSTWADDDKLTTHLKSGDFFDVAKYPAARFVTTEIKPGGADGATHTVVGNLTLHGVTKSIEFPATLTVTDGEASLASEFFIKRSDFGVSYGPGVIREEVVIKLDVKAPRAKTEG